MTCTSPLILGNQGEGRVVPCGQCMACRMTRVTEWVVRCMHERASWKSSSFVTLTYRDGELPADNSLDKGEFTKFWKRLRKRLGKPLRYYGCGEYGEKKGRPHYHAIIFGIPPSQVSLVELAWGHGHVDAGYVTAESVRYTVDYITKAIEAGHGALAVMKGEAWGGRVPPFAVMSHGMGREYCDRYGDRIRRFGVFSASGKPMGVPRYYRERLKEDEPRYQAYTPEEQLRYWGDREQRAANKAAAAASRRKSGEFRL